MSTAQTPDDRDVLAGEYVLGLMPEAERLVLEQRMASDPLLAVLVEEWRLRLQPLDDTATALDGGPALWQRILHSTGQEKRAGLDPLRRPAFSLQPLWDSLAFWRVAGLAALAAALLLAIGLASVLMRAAPTPVYVAVLVSDANRPAAIVNTFADGSADILPLEDIDVPPGKMLEVWTLWDRAAGPRSIGKLDRARTGRLTIKHLPIGPNQLFEITLEPQGGSPIGRPTGPVLMKGLTATAL